MSVAALSSCVFRDYRLISPASAASLAEIKLPVRIISIVLLGPTSCGRRRWAMEGMVPILTSGMPEGGLFRCEDEVTTRRQFVPAPRHIRDERQSSDGGNA